MTENVGLKLLAFFLAAGLVYVRAHEKITQQQFSGILVGLSNIPKNMVLAIPERTYTTDIVLRGPQSILNWLKPKDLRFTLDLSQHAELIQNRVLRVRLGIEHFTPNLEERERQQLNLSEEDIHPSQVLVTVHPYDIAKKEPPAVFESEDSEDVIEIPLYLLMKDVPVRVLTSGDPPEGYRVSTESTPNIITLTGPKAALDRINDVTTTPIIVTTLDRSFTTEVSLPEVGREDSPVSATTTRVTVKLTVSRKKGGT